MAKAKKAKPDSVEIRLHFKEFSTGTAMAQAALEKARQWPDKLDLESRSVRRDGEEVVFTFQKAVQG